MRMSMSNRAGRLVPVLCSVMLLAALHPTSAGAGRRVAAYLFDGTPGTQTPNTVPDVGGDTSLDLAIGSSAQYNVDSPFSGAGDTSLDVAGGIQERAANDVTDAFKFSNSVPWSVVAWFKTSVSGGTRQIVSQRRASTGNGWSLSLGSNDKPFMFVQGQTAPQARSTGGDTTLIDGQWHMLVGIHDPDFDADGAIQLYVDGSANVFTSSKSQTESIDYTTAKFSVGTGRDGGGNYNPFSGVIDDVGVFDHALTAQEVDFYFLNSVGTPVEVAFTTVDVTDAAVFEFQSLLGLTYRFDRATTLGPPDDFTDTGLFLQGDGNTMIMVDPAGPSSSYIYRIVIP